MNRENLLQRLQDWYTAHCDGDWEHTYGIKISTIDNPGWELSVDLSETELSNRSFKAVEQETDERNWYHCKVRDARFQGFGGPKNLEDLLEQFLNWAQPAG